MTELFSWLLLGFASGSIPFGWLVGRWQGVDVRRLGSGNIGATNVARVTSFKAGLITLCADMAKGALPTATGVAYSDLPWAAALAALGAVCGHMFTPFLRFRGGKGVATAAGAMLVLAPRAFFGAAVVFLLVAAATRIVSLSSLVASAVLPPLCWLTGVSGPVQTVSVICAVLIWIRHRDNVVRILRGTELPPPAPLR